MSKMGQFKSRYNFKLTCYIVFSARSQYAHTKARHRYTYMCVGARVCIDYKLDIVQAVFYFQINRFWDTTSLHTYRHVSV